MTATTPSVASRPPVLPPATARPASTFPGGIRRRPRRQYDVQPDGGIPSDLSGSISFSGGETDRPHHTVGSRHELYEPEHQRTGQHHGRPRRRAVVHQRRRWPVLLLGFVVGGRDFAPRSATGLSPTFSLQVSIPRSAASPPRGSSASTADATPEGRDRSQSGPSIRPTSDCRPQV